MATQQTGLLSYGSYIPYRRLQRTCIHSVNKWFAPELAGLAKGEKAIANWDEDSITMAVEAGRNCLQGIDREQVHSLCLSSTTLPFADRLNSGIAKEALNLSDTVTASDRTGNLRAGTTALMQALDGDQIQLCLATDRRKARIASSLEMTYGDAAAGILVGVGEIIATYIGGCSSTIDFIDHFRASGADFDYTWEARFLRDEGYQKILGTAIKEALTKLNIKGADIHHAAIVAPTRGMPQKLAAVAGINDDAVIDTLVARVGDTGVAHPLLMLTAALDKAKPGQKVLLASFGQGADVLVFEATDAITSIGQRFAAALSRRMPDENYARYLHHRGLLDIEKGMRAELDEKQPGTTLYRDRKTVLGLIGGRCTKTGVAQFPKSDISVNPDGHLVHTQEDYPLAERRSRILSFTVDRQTYSPDPPTYYGMIDFDGGGRMVVEYADVMASDVQVDAEMRMVFRIKAFDDRRHFRKYFWKATPIRNGYL